MTVDTQSKDSKIFLSFILGAGAYIGLSMIWLFWLHPLAHIPGPPLGIASRWYQCYYDCFYKRGGRLPFKLAKLHERYGPIIRIASNQLHINDPAFMDTIYAVQERNTPPNDALMVPESLAGAEDYHLHKLRRDAVSSFFSQKFIFSLESRIREKVDKLQEIFVRYVDVEDGNKVLNISDAYFAFTNDLVHCFCFRTDNDLLNDLDEARKQRKSLRAFLLRTRFRAHFGWVLKFLPSWLLQNFPAAAITDLLHFRKLVSTSINLVLAEGPEIDPGLDSYSLFHALCDSPDLPPREKTASRLLDEATLLVMAGTESTALACNIATYYILSRSDVMGKLQRELAELRGVTNATDLPLKMLLKLPYLRAVLEETHRLSFGATGQQTRYAPYPLVYNVSYGPNGGNTYHIPSQTWMSCVSYCAHTNKSLFPDPMKFQPERWLVEDQEVLRTRRRAIMTFGKNPKICLGKHLADAALCLVISNITMTERFSMELYDTHEERDIRFQHDQQIAYAALESPGVRVRLRRK